MEVRILQGQFYFAISTLCLPGLPGKPQTVAARHPKPRLGVQPLA